ncbi:MAG: pilus assembly protein PilM [Lachnospiraceae bacterium]|nr:pilus assembly protein PilM [Lachnospiraceae bacterium]
MAQKTLSIYIGENQIRIVELSKNSKQNLNIHKMASIMTPPESVQDGMLIDIEQVATQIRNCISEMEIKSRNVIFTVSSKRCSSKEVDVPCIRHRDKINEILLRNSRDYFPMSNPEDYVYSHNLLQIRQTENGNKVKHIMAVAIPKEIVEAYRTLAEQLGLRMESIDYTSNSILQLVKQNLSTDSHLLIQMEEDISYVSIVANGVTVLQRSISYGIYTAMETLAELRGVTEEQARALFKESPECITEKEYEEVAFVLLNSIARLLDFYTSRNGTIEIQTIHLYSTSGLCLQIGHVLQNEIGSETIYVKELKGVSVDKGVSQDFGQLFYYMACIGAAIEPMGFLASSEAVKEDNDSKTRKNLMLAFMMTGAISVLAMTVTIVCYFGVQHEKKEMLDAIHESVSMRELERNYLQVQAEYETIADFYETTRNDNEKLYDFIVDLEERMPESVGITGLQAASGAISIAGTSRGKEAVAELIIQLKNLEYVENVFVSNISETFDEFDVPTTTFSLTCTMRYIVETTENVDKKIDAKGEGMYNEAE